MTTSLEAYLSAFADILTSDERNLLLNPPYVLDVPLDSLIEPMRRRNQTRYSRPPRPANSWVLFCKNFNRRLRSQYPEQSYMLAAVTRMAMNDWNNQPIVVRQYFDLLSRLAMQRHREVYPLLAQTIPSA
ncbi:5309_t:CDS:1 [Paraglomus brasilianum]|uniref:5309_t:CDS:1 n=1 Tax=Paraglomus brasilianum TaxID=144538 RepID=A0A9N9AJR0_9GLOM|nr:5309_t:CDS:1 [Paraglomus brasilianum]